MLVSVILSRVRTFLRYREAVQGLERLSDRELRDLGVQRTDIREIARAYAGE